MASLNQNPFWPQLLMKLGSLDVAPAAVFDSGAAATLKKRPRVLSTLQIKLAANPPTRSRMTSEEDDRNINDGIPGPITPDFG